MRTLTRLGAPILSALALSACGSAAQSDPTGVTDDALTSPQFNEVIPGNGTYVMKGLGLKCVDGGSLSAGAPVVLNTCNGATSQQLTLVEAAPLSDVVTIRVGDLCLTPQGGIASAGATMVLAACNGSAAQSWTLEPLRGGVTDVSWDFKSKGNGTLYLNVKGGLTTDGTPLQMLSAATTGIGNSWSLTQIEIAGSVPISPRSREGRLTVRDHRGGTTKKSYYETFQYQDQSSTETGYEVWTKSWNPQYTDPRPWTLVANRPALAGTGGIATERPTLEANRVYYVAARATNAAGGSGPATTLIKTTPANAPKTAWVTSVSTSSVSVSWQAPDVDPQRVDGYRVQNGSQTIDVSGDARGTTITGLTPGSHCFTVTSYNDIWGASMPMTACGVTLGTPPLGDQQTSISMERQEIISGPIPYLGRFGPISPGAVITKVNFPTQFPGVLLVKPGHSTEECNSNPDAVISVHGDMTDAQKVAVWGSATPTITGGQVLNLVGCSESATVLNWLPVNLTWHYVQP